MVVVRPGLERAPRGKMLALRWSFEGHDIHPFMGNISLITRSHVQGVW